MNQKEINELREKYFKQVDELLALFSIPLIKKISAIYFQGSSTANVMLDSNSKPPKITKQLQELFSNLIAENMKGVEDDFKREVSNTLNIGLSQEENKKQLIQRLDNLFKGENSTRLKYENRLKLILRTESARIFNGGTFRSAKKLGAKYKYQIGVSDNREGEDSKIVLRKYGSPEKAIPIDEPFEYTYNGQKRSFMFNPDRPNDRGTCIFLYDLPKDR